MHEGERNHSRGYLPHLVRRGASYFVTFRLADSLPAEALARLDAEERRIRIDRSAKLEAEEQERERRKRIEGYLDAGAGTCSLGEPRVAEAACATLRYFDGDRYDLDEWVVMPNHVHVIVRPKDGWRLSEILHSWKLRIAREANRILMRKRARFWQPESFDRVIRDEEEKARVRRYIRRNPVKARLCASDEEWRWGSACPGWKEQK